MLSKPVASKLLVSHSKRRKYGQEQEEHSDLIKKSEEELLRVERALWEESSKVALPDGILWILCWELGGD